MKFFRYFPLLTLGLIFVWYFSFYTGTFQSLWMKPDSQAAKLLASGKEEEALKTFENKLSVGAIYYKRAEFKKALKIYETLGTKEAFYNRGNTLVMLGKYNKAIEAYKLALEVDAHFKEAKENMSVALARQALLDEAKKQGNKEGTGGQLSANEIRYDNKNNEGQSMQDFDNTGAKEGTATWLDRLETSPAKFLEAKFSYQLQSKGKEK